MLPEELRLRARIMRLTELARTNRPLRPRQRQSMVLRMLVTVMMKWTATRMRLRRRMSMLPLRKSIPRR
jgi:hypothetical protein